MKKKTILLTLLLAAVTSVTFGQKKNNRKAFDKSAVDVASPYEYVGTLPPCPRITLDDGTEFLMKECHIVGSTHIGDTDQTFEVTLVPSTNGSYTYMASNRITNFPDFGAYVDIGSGTVTGDLKFHVTMLNRGFPDDGQKKTYSGTLDVILVRGSSSQKVMKLPFQYTVVPKEKGRG